MPLALFIEINYILRVLMNEQLLFLLLMKQYVLSTCSTKCFTTLEALMSHETILVCHETKVKFIYRREQTFQYSLVYFMAHLWLT